MCSSPIYKRRRQRPISTKATRMPPNVDILGNQRRAHLIPCLCGLGWKRTPALEMEVRVFVYLIIIIRHYVAINELMGRKTIFNQLTINRQSICQVSLIINARITRFSAYIIGYLNYDWAIYVCNGVHSAYTMLKSIKYKKAVRQHSTS